jgi:L-fuconolactonase
MPPRIDAHQHFWRYAPETHGWIDESMVALRRDFLPHDLEPLLNEADIDGCIAVQAQQDSGETEWLLELADAHPFIRGVVGWVDLCAPDAPKQLERLASHPRLCAIRHVVQSEPDGFMLRAEFQRGIATLAEFGLAYDILIYARQLPEATTLVGAFPDQRFVVDHIAKPGIRAREIREWARDMTALARYPNVQCKLSGMVTEADWDAWTPADFAPYMDVVFDCFGPERLLVGSDWPVCTVAGSYQDVMSVIMSRIDELTARDRAAVLGGNATRFYRLAP